jgi:23S rRNA (adenine2503-C2)-methyltransferase
MKSLNLYRHSSRCSSLLFRRNFDTPPSQRVRASASTPVSDVIDPTFVPRQAPDGQWSKIDSSLVEMALKDIKASDKTSELVLLGKTASELGKLAEKHAQQPSFRGKQLLDGLLKGARSIKDIKVIPSTLKDGLIKAGCTTGRSVIYHTSASPCGTTKFLLQLNDGRVIECVGEC